MNKANVFGIVALAVLSTLITISYAGVPACPSSQVYMRCPRCIWECGQESKNCTGYACRWGCACPGNTLWNGSWCADACPEVCPSNLITVDCRRCRWACEQNPNITCAAPCERGCDCPAQTYWDGFQCSSTCPSTWEQWSDCSETCGNGVQRRTRFCPGVDNCGNLSEERTCNLGNCSNSGCPSNQVFSTCSPCIWRCDQNPASTACPNFCIPRCTCPFATLWNGTACVTTCPVCPGNQKYSTCGTCNIPCDQRINPPICTLECKIGCFCEFNTFLNGDQCVPEADCPAECPSNQVWDTCPSCIWECGQDPAATLCPLECTPRCTCPNGTLWNGSSCVENCPVCPANQQFSNCGTCNTACADRNDPPACTLDCKYGCFCPPNTFLDGQQCVAENQCPQECPSNQVWDICPSCIWECGQDPAVTLCATVCTPRCTCPDGTLWDGSSCVENCPTCPGNQQYSTCGGCNTLCSQKDQPVPCTLDCKIGCFCPPNTFLDGEQCVEENQCPQECPSNQVWDICPSCIWECGQDPAVTLCAAVCTPRCTCPDGTLWDGSSCVENCPTCPGNQQYSTCGGCNTLCSQKDQPVPCTLDCKIGCFCPPNTFLDGEQCVEENQCPQECPSNQVWDICPSCIWECGQDPAVTLCAAVCTPRCTCPDGTLWDGSSCVENCPTCPGNQQYSTCGGCNTLCSQKDQPVPCTLDCKIGCFCPPNTFLDGDQCVSADQCPLDCDDALNELFRTCAPPCDATCQEPNKLCSLQESCNRRCACPSGLVRNSENVCVNVTSCHGCNSARNEVWDNCAKPCDASCASPNSCTYGFCTPRCACPAGHFRNQQKVCVLRSECYACFSSLNEVWDPCAPLCDATCAQPNSFCSLLQVCKQRCACAHGNLRNAKGVCVRRAECPGLCAIGVPTVNCLVDPCLNAECPHIPEATCRSNYCGGCNAVFYVGDDKKSDDECNGCDASLNEVWNSCAAPCDATCDDKQKPCSLLRRCTIRCACPAGHFRNSQAKCVPYSQCPLCPSNQEYFFRKPCGWKCNTGVDLFCRFFGESGCACHSQTQWNGTHCVPKNQCPSPPGHQCPPGTPVASCEGLPCDLEKCPAHPDAKCTNSYCGGCKAIFTKHGRTLTKQECTVTRCNSNLVWRLCPQINRVCNHYQAVSKRLYGCTPLCVCPENSYWNGGRCVTSYQCTFRS